jgi:signal transduction histidine kinase
MLVRGESVIASTGLALAAILLLSLAAAGGWTVYIQRNDARADTHARLDFCGKLFTQALEPLLASRQDSQAVQLLVSAARENRLSRCRIVLGDGTSFVDAQEKLSVRRAAGEWPPGTPPPAREQSTPAVVLAEFPLSIEGRGEARLDLAAGVVYPPWVGWEAQAGIGAITAAGFVALLAVYRRLRSRVGAIGAVREALLALRAGETASNALAVDSRLGPEAEAWNRLLAERERLHTDVAGGRARETLGIRRDLKNDLAAACDALWQGLLIIDDELRVKYANGAAAVFLRAKRDDLVGSVLIQYTQDAQLLESIKAVSTGAVKRRATIEVKQPEDKGGGVLRFNVRPVRRDDSGGAVVMIEDITQQRVADEARNAFVAQATHELRTPLTNIRLYVEQAIEAPEGDVKTRAKCLNVINQESRRLERIVGDMLSVSEIEAGTLKLRTDDVRLDSVFEDLRADFEATAKDKGVALAIDLPPKLPVIWGDRDKIVLAIHNLVGNAIKYTPKGGSVTVRVLEQQGGIVVDIVDTGIGISPEEQELIFDRFYRAKDQRIANITGSGLGLALAREVVRLHGGDISVRSQIDHGSTFSISLPARAQAA